MTLLEISPGTWVNPEAVTSVIARQERRGITKADDGSEPPSVDVRIGDYPIIVWQFDTFEQAKGYAKKIASILNLHKNHYAR